MTRPRYLRLALILACLPAAALAAEPFDINGLHTGLSFGAAVSRAEALGGTCTSRAVRSRTGNVRASCDFPPCADDAEGDACAARAAAADIRQLKWVGFEGPGETAALTRMVILFEDSPEEVAARLEARFGPAAGGRNLEELRDEDPGWTHTRRLGWARGDYRMGLSDAEGMLLLTTDAAQEVAPPGP